MVDKVTQALETVVTLFRKRNPNFSGSVNLAAHGMGAVIAMDILAHQDASSSASGSDSAAADAAPSAAVELPAVEDSDDESDNTSAAAASGDTGGSESLPALAPALEKEGLMVLGAKGLINQISEIHSRRLALYQVWATWWPNWSLRKLTCRRY